MKKITYLIILLSQLLLVAFAQSSFIVKEIEFQGLDHISQETVENYLPLKVGQALSPDRTAHVLRALYRTGFFDYIHLLRKDHTLIIQVTERPTIGQLKIIGNSVIPTDKLTTVMKTLDIAEGRIYNPAILDKIKVSLLNQYYQLGRYNARVDISVTPMTRNRVSVRIDISEGLVTKVRQISIVGNVAFDEKTLINQLELTTSGLFTVFTQTDRYSEQRLDVSLEKLRFFYLDHGYLRFEVKSAQAEMTPDRKSVYIVIVVSEGEPYYITDFELNGSLLFPREEYLARMTIHPGERFSRQKVIDSEKAISTYLGNKGYLFSNISLIPQIDDELHQVKLIFDVKLGKLDYVRRILFADNTRTNDESLRREVIQMESAPASLGKLEESKHRLSLLPYLKDVDMSVHPVEEVDDQVDVVYKVKEENTSQASFKIGYAASYGFLIGAGLNQKNFFGTGNTLNVNINRSSYEQYYGIEYTDPYYTLDGISRTFNFQISRVNPGALKNVNSGYFTNEYDFGVMYGIPVGAKDGTYSRIMAGAAYQNTLVYLNTDHPRNISNQVNSFVKRHGRRYQELDLKLGYSRDSRDRAIFPTQGDIQSLFVDFYAPLSRSSLTYYNLNYHGRWFQPLYHQFVLLTKGDFGYGNAFNGVQNYPFFRNYFAGGPDTVRGYETFTLGPLDSVGQSYGGNVLLYASMGLIFPNFISDNLRTTAFVDAGNVYLTRSNRAFGGASTNSGPIRYSAGVQADMLTPFGLIGFSLAKPLNARPFDRSEIFQLVIGANL